jgi:hypothetical protein
MDVDQAVDVNSSATPVSYPEDKPYDMDVDQAVDANSPLGHASLSTPDSCPDLPGNDASLPVVSNSASHSRIELERSSPVPLPSMSSPDESAQTPLITSKTSKGTLVFTKSHDTKFSYDSVRFIPNAPRSRVKSKSKSKSRSKVPVSIFFSLPRLVCYG